jgi:hypothetical protein
MLFKDLSTDAKNKVLFDHRDLDVDGKTLHGQAQFYYWFESIYKFTKEGELADVI